MDDSVISLHQLGVAGMREMQLASLPEDVFL